jgi:hypothetical protein
VTQRDLNLLDLSLRHIEPPLSPRHLAIAWGLTAVAMLLWGGVTRWERMSVAEQEAAASRQVDAGRTEMTTLAAQLAARQPSPALATDIEARKRDIVGRDAAVDALERSGGGAAGGPGPVLRAFARGTVEGVWLTALSIDPGSRQVGASGRSLDAALIPVWLQGLGRDDALRGQVFDQLVVSRPEPDKPAAGPTAAGAAAPAAAPAKPAFVEFVVGTVAPAAEAGR